MPLIIIPIAKVIVAYGIARVIADVTVISIAKLTLKNQAKKETK